MGGDNATYKVVVDYRISLDEMIAAGRYDIISDVKAEYFPVSGVGWKEVDLELVHLNRDARTEEVLEELERQGLLLAKIEELLALGAKYPDLQRQFPIIVLGSIWRNPDGIRYVPSLCWLGPERTLHLRLFDRHWCDSSRFLAVRK